MYIFGYLRHIHLEIYIFSFRGGESQERRASQLGAEKNLFQILAEKKQARKEGAKRKVKEENRGERKKLAKTVQKNAKSRKNLKESQKRKNGGDVTQKLSWAERVQQSRQRWEEKQAEIFEKKETAKDKDKRNSKNKVALLSGAVESGGRKKLKTKVTFNNRRPRGREDNSGTNRDSQYGNKTKFSLANLFGRTRQIRNRENKTRINESGGRVDRMARAIFSIESDGRLRAKRFEKHVYRKALKGRYGPGNPKLLATSMGIPQIMGFNWKEAGFSSVEHMHSVMMNGSKGDQIRAYANFINSKPVLKRAIAEKNFHKVALYYNGKNYKKGGYHLKLENAYNQIA